VFSSVTDISFAAGSNNISYNSINKKATFSFNFNQYYNESYYYINSAVRESVWWRGCGVWFYPGFWDFVGIFSDIFFGRIDGRRFVVCVVGIVGDVQYIFYEGPDVFDGVTYLDSISVSVSVTGERKPAGR
jgi:hypothetical protein